MEKKTYKTPKARIIQLEGEGLICTSYGTTSVGGTTKEYDAPEYRTTLWGED